MMKYLMPCNQNICIKIFFASTDPKGLCLHEREKTTGRFLALSDSLEIQAIWEIKYLLEWRRRGGGLRKENKINVLVM